MGTMASETMRREIRISVGKRAHTPGSTLTIVASDHELRTAISAQLAQSRDLAECKVTAIGPLISTQLSLSGTVVYLPSLKEEGMVPDLAEAAEVFAKCRGCGVDAFLLVSSAMVYDASFRNPGLICESYPISKDRSPVAIAARWRRLENIATRHFEDRQQLTILRCATVLSQLSANRIAGRFKRRVATAMPGHDPTIQLLSPVDMAHAIDCVVRTGASGIFNVAPDGVIPLRQALKRAGTRRIPIPRTILRIAQAIRSNSPATHLDFSRYSWTVSNAKIKALGFSPEFSSAAALTEFCRHHRVPNCGKQPKHGHFDDFGMDKDYIALYGGTLFRFLADWYWRIEVAGIENIPPTGRAVLAGIHRGFMPWDGVMALDLVVKQTGRYPRFLIHPGLVKFPFLANFMTKLGGVLACQENAERILESGELLGVFPEGIQGAFILSLIHI